MKRVRRLFLSAAVVAVTLAAMVVAVSPSESPGAGTPDSSSAGQERRYFIAADEVLWDYTPSGEDGITGEPFGDEANVFVERGARRIGSTYRKVLYRAYTDASFTTPAPHDPDLGFLGPVIRAEVGDTITVVFRNNATRPYSIHAHGVFYTKENEGAPYDDGTAGQDKDDDGVPPGETYTYRYAVPERAGPSPDEGSSALWMYHSHTDEVKDTNAGLVGPLVVTGRGKARADGSPDDVDKEVFTFFQVTDENQSWYLDENIAEFARRPGSVDTDDEEFEESNLMHSINGFVYGNGPVPTVEAGQRVRWYTFSLGTEVDLHTPHWHGQTVTAMKMRTDVVNLLPGAMVIADMVPDSPGTWLYHCHVNDHILAGMQMLYRVTGGPGPGPDANPRRTHGHDH